MVISASADNGDFHHHLIDGIDVPIGEKGKNTYQAFRSHEGSSKFDLQSI